MKIPHSAFFCNASMLLPFFTFSHISSIVEISCYSLSIHEKGYCRTIAMISILSMALF